MQLVSLCETRWTERREAVLMFKILFTNIVDALGIISQWKDNDSSSKAESLIHSLMSTKFIVSLFCLFHVLNVTINLSRTLQKKSIDKNSAKSLVNDILFFLHEKRSNEEYCFNEIFNDVKHEKFNIPILVPRITSKQRNRVNIQTNSPNDYYRVSIFIPLLDNIIEDLNFRFHSEMCYVFDINDLIPTNVTKLKTV